MGNTEPPAPSGGSEPIPSIVIACFLGAVAGITAIIWGVLVGESIGKIVFMGVTSFFGLGVSIILILWGVGLFYPDE
jgi:hypothetical protein